MSVNNTFTGYSVVSNNNFVNYAVSALVGVTAVCVNGLWNGASCCFRENAVRRELLEKIEEHLIDPNESIVAKVYFRELKQKITSTGRTQDPSKMGREFETTSRAYQELVRKVESVAFRAEEGYEEVLEELRSLKTCPITDTERSIYIGRITRALRELDNANGAPRHKFCGCHILEEGRVKKQGITGQPVAFPTQTSQNSSLQGRSVLSSSWSLGGGHNVAQRGISQRLAPEGMHAYHVAADNETLLPFDTLRSLTNGRYTDPKMIEFLLRNNYWKTLNLINWAFGGKPGPVKYQKLKDQFIRTLLERGAPELQMTFFSRFAGAAANGAGEIGVADINIATDLLSDFFDVEKPSDIDNPHFANGAMVEGERVLAQSKTRVGVERTHITGFPVRKAFLETYDALALRAERNIAPDARVVLLASGGVGVDNKYAEQIVDHYRSNPNADKIHLVVLCGGNEKQKKRLEKQFAGLHLSHLTVEIRGWTEEEEIAKLNAIAADPHRRGALISSKGGGGTLSEGLASGVPMLIQSRNEIAWEKENIAYVSGQWDKENIADVSGQKYGLQFKGANDLIERLRALFHFKGANDLIEQLGALFQMEYHRIEIDSKERSVDLIRSQITAAEADSEFQALREEALRYQPPTIKELLN